MSKDEQQPQCATGASNRERVTTLEREMCGVRLDIKEIKDTLLGRPTWAVTVIITILTALSCSSITFAITALNAVIRH
jgi:hypothetical protein